MKLDMVVVSEVPGFTSAVLNRARLSRDVRFDGKFFIAVLSTGIYCRPICPAPRCKRSNVVFYPTPAAAEAAGYRPCRRCRPEVAPGSPAWLGPAAVVRRALRLIEAGTLDDGTVEQLATRIGVGARHLSRLFVEHVGVSPIAVALSRRLQFSRQLIDETPWSMSYVAIASGFRSVRRFNEAYRRAFHCSPRESRRQRRAGLATTHAGEVALTLGYRAPYDWRALSTFLSQRAVPGLERVDERGYARTVRLPRGHALINIAPLDGFDALRLTVARAAPTHLFEIVTTARRMFDLSADPQQIAEVLRHDQLLAQPLHERPGLRIAGTWDAFECAVRALLGEGIDQAASHECLQGLITRCGDPIAEPRDGLTHLFPTPERVARDSLDGLALGGARRAALRAVAAAALAGNLDVLAPADGVARALASLPGFDPASAQYVVMRGLGDPDAFPLSERIMRCVSEASPGISGKEATEARTHAWRPWRGYAALHMCQAGRSDAVCGHDEDATGITIRTRSRSW